MKVFCVDLILFQLCQRLFGVNNSDETLTDDIGNRYWPAKQLSLVIFRLIWQSHVNELLL